MPKCRVVVLIGGSGSNLQALIDSQECINAVSMVSVVSHRPDAYGLTRAKNANIPTVVISHLDYSERDAFEADLQQAIDNFNPDLVLLAGFMRVLSEKFVSHYAGKLLNIHPSLLPKYKGLHTHQRVLAAGDSEHGASVHFVTSELDGGPIVAQIRVPVLPKDTEETLSARVLKAEHHLFPQVVAWFAQNRLKYDQNIVTLDGKRLTPQGLQLSLPTMQGIVS
ncbi:MAG: phosphoribosylglycinamide formyltransferase [Proteobacteria bacterium]|nr:phosphoribosylglycinamide formyltransferase [Pseudomonadota bacterium]